MIKRIAAVAGILFFLLMGGLTVYSRTAYQSSLPRVTIDLPRPGSFTPEDGSGRRTLENTLPQEAVHTSGADSYVWIVKEVQGAWGKEYAVEQRYVACRSIDDGRVYLLGRVDSPVVISSDKPLLPGQSVRFYP